MCFLYGYEQKSVGAILGAGPVGGPRGLQAGVTHQPGEEEEEEVAAAVDERGTEAVTEAGGVRQAGHDVAA
jgi:hypothetical protein